MGGGYAPFAALGGAGLRLDSKRFLLDTNGQYDNGRKVNDNDQPNPKGHDRALVGSAYYRFPSAWSFGVGVRWSELSTTNYKKSSWAPTFGGSKDYFHNHCQLEGCGGNFSLRLGVDYVLKGSNWQNGRQGPLFTSLHAFAFGESPHFLARNSRGLPGSMTQSRTGRMPC